MGVCEAEIYPDVLQSLGQGRIEIVQYLVKQWICRDNVNLFIYLTLFLGTKLPGLGFYGVDMVIFPRGTF